MRLVYKGNLLIDDLSLDFYRVDEFDTLFLLPARKEFSSRFSIYSLIKQLLNLLEVLPTASQTEYNALPNRIKLLNKDPILVSSGRINNYVQQIRDYSGQIVELAHIESLPDGVRAMHSIRGEDKNDSEPCSPTVTEVDYRNNNSEKPLPVFWRKRTSSVFQNVAKASIGSKRASVVRSNSGSRAEMNIEKALETSVDKISIECMYPDLLRERFSKQIEMLKQMEQIGSKLTQGTM